MQLFAFRMSDDADSMPLRVFFVNKKCGLR